MSHQAHIIFSEFFTNKRTPAASTKFNHFLPLSLFY
ncbi:Uncharacterised protein [Vibrio cholerae]|nr:Uncharacterised protein [Vibrio cholerae]